LLLAKYDQFTSPDPKKFTNFKTFFHH